MNDDRRIGKVDISGVMMKTCLYHLAQIFKDTFTIHIEHSSHLDKVTYTLYCSEFDEVKEGCVIPHYVFEANKQGQRTGIRKA